MYFGKAHMWLIDKYNVRDGPCTHMSEWVEAYGKQPMQMHMDLALGNTVNKHVLGRQLHERSLQLG